MPFVKGTPLKLPAKTLILKNFKSKVFEKRFGEKLFTKSFSPIFFSVSSKAVRGDGEKSVKTTKTEEIYSASRLKMQKGAKIYDKIRAFATIVLAIIVYVAIAKLTSIG